MSLDHRAIRTRRLAASLIAVALLVAAGASLRAWPQQAGQKPPAGLPSETPATFAPTNDGFDYERRDVMIPMRDGVKLHTVVLVPKGATRAPILLTRTPYNATALTSNAPSAHLGATLWGYDNATEVIVEGGYIRVVQDVRGKFGSEGDYDRNPQTFVPNIFWAKPGDYRRAVQRIFHAPGQASFVELPVVR